MTGLLVAGLLPATALAIVPTLTGASAPRPSSFSFLNQLEGGTIDHTNHHDTRANRRLYARQLARCARADYRNAHPVSCPAPAGGRRSAVASRGQLAQEVDGYDVTGKWDPLIHIPSNAIHAVVLPTNKILWFSQPKSDDERGGNAYVWDPATGVSTRVDPPDVTYPDGSVAPANIWCGGQAQLPDGRVLVVGGNLAYADGTGAGSGFKGAPWVFTFNPWTETWTRYHDMPHGRWYPTVTTLPDGRALILGGWDETGGKADPVDPNGAAVMFDDQDIETFDPGAAPGSAATTVVGQLPGAPGGPTYPDHRGLGLYPHVFVLPGNTMLGAGGHKVLIAGPLQWDSGVLDTTNWRWTDLPTGDNGSDPPRASDRSWGTAILEPAGTGGPTKVALISGSNSAASAPGDPNSAPPPLRTADVLDLNDPTEAWTNDPTMALNTGRGHFQTVILPDESLLTTGGGYGEKDGSLYADPVYGAELRPDGADAWMQVGSEDDARTYHSTAVLLPDGRVVSAGDDRPEHIDPANRTAQIYEPPYLFKGARPQVTFAPSAVRYGAQFRVAVTGTPGAVTRAVLMRPNAVTHSNDMDQRAMELTVTAQADGLTLTSPADATVAPPGYYELFLLNAKGVPSVASWVHLDPSAPDAPALPDPATLVPPPAAPVAAPAPAPVATAPAATAIVPVTTPAGGVTAPLLGTPSTAARAAADTTAPRLTLGRPSVRLTGRRAVVALTVRSSEAATARLELRRPGRTAPVALATLPLRSGVQARGSLRVTLAAGAPTTRLDVVVIAADAAGNRTTARTTVGRGQVAAALIRSARTRS